ncbi:DUF7342 family protein [Haloarchaeobius sp. DYHT-AS-18]|uniref:DUF7342 family protein n=1 Tax=Haloarchaeobius sp. DYHT-AS-18 TaxID=3446117 RepID=UPI003EB91ADE
MADRDSPDDAPEDVGSFAESWGKSVADRSTKERVYEVVTGLTEPTPVSEIAELADCSPGGARTNLQWLDEMGVVEQTASDPALYRRNEAYFDFLRIERLTREYSRTELEALVEEYETRVDELETELDATEVDGSILADVPFDELEDRYDQLSELQALRRRIRDARQALLRLKRDEDGSGDVFQPA